MVYFRFFTVLKPPDDVAIRVFLIAAALSFVAVAFVFTLPLQLLERVSIPWTVHGWSGILLFILIAPVSEELLFRGFLFGFLRQNFSVGISVAISAACFALMHGSLLSPQLAGGIIFALGYEYSRNLWVPILLHTGANTAVLLIDQIKLT